MSNKQIRSADVGAHGCAPDSALSTQHSALSARWRSYDWHLIPAVPRDPAMNMALDAVLTERVGAGKRHATLWIWGWNAPCVVLGRFQSVRNEIDEEGARALGIGFVRRITGGGAMFIQPGGAITYSVIAPESLVAGMSFAESYAFLDSWAVDGLRALGVDATYVPLNDITSSTGKIGGAAQARRGGAVLHHATIACELDTEQMARVLRIGREKLSDKGIASAAKRVSPLRQQTDLPRDTIIALLVASFANRYGLIPDAVHPDEEAEAARRVTEQFGTRDWLYILP
ncbi:MAG: lipoate--protein ligase family protein [Thermomicrobiales bacterium]